MLQHVIAEASELASSWRWSNHDGSGSAKVMPLFDRVASPEQYRRFRTTSDGQFLVALLEQYEEAMNDDWLPDNICGMNLERAEKFIAMVAQLLESGGSLAIAELKRRYRVLAQP